MCEIAISESKTASRKFSPATIRIAIICLGVFCTLFFWFLFVKENVQKHPIISAQGGAEGSLIIRSEEEISQQITIDHTNGTIGSIDLYFGQTSLFSIGFQEQLEIQTALINEHGETVNRETTMLKFATTDKFVEVLSDLENLPNGIYTLKILNLTEEENPSRTLLYGDFVSSSNLQDGNQFLEGSLYLLSRSTSTYKAVAVAYLFFQVILWCSIMLIYQMIYVWKLEKRKIYTFAFAMLCFIYLFLQVPNGTPDEQTHYLSSYRVSNQLLLIKEDASRDVSLRPSDQLGGTNFISWNTSSMESYNYFFEHLFDRTEESPRENLITVSTLWNSSVFETFNYLPSALSITISRILHIGPMGTYTLARLANIVCVLFLFYFSMKRLPFGQELFFVIACFPVFLQEVASISYDALILGISYFAMAEVLHYLYSNEKSISKKEKIFTLLLFFCLGAFKSGIYSLIPLFLLIPKFVNQIKTKNKKGYLETFTMLWVLFFGMIFFTLLFRGRIDTISYNGFPIAQDGTTLYYSIKYIVMHPWAMIKMFYYTFFTKLFYFYLSSSIGALGWFNLPLNDSFIFLFALTAIFSAISSSHSKIFPSKGERIWWSISLLGVLAIISVALINGWTSYLRGDISGLQGRYFLPLLPIALITVFRNRKIQYKQNYSNFLIFWLIGISYISLQYYWSIILAR